MPVPSTSPRRAGYTVVLRAFRLLPPVLRRLLVHLGTPSFTVGAVCAVEHEGELLVLRQPHRPGWSLPGGLLDRGEGPATAVQREVEEETGLRVRVGVPLTVQVNPRVRRVDVVYRVPAGYRPDVSPGGEARRSGWLRPDQVLADCDDPTREIVELLARSTAPAASDGRLLGP